MCIVEAVPCQEDADMAKYLDKRLAIEKECEERLQHYQNELSWLETERQRVETENQREIERVEEAALEKLSDKEQQLKERKVQVAELERETS